MGILTEISAFPSKFTVLSKYFCNARIFGQTFFTATRYLSTECIRATHLQLIIKSRFPHLAGLIICRDSHSLEVLICVEYFLDIFVNMVRPGDWT